MSSSNYTNVIKISDYIYNTYKPNDWIQKYNMTVDDIMINIKKIINVYFTIDFDIIKNYYSIITIIKGETGLTNDFIIHILDEINIYEIDNNITKIL